MWQVGLMVEIGKQSGYQLVFMIRREELLITCGKILIKESVLLLIKKKN